MSENGKILDAAYARRKIKKSLAKRHFQETRFKFYGLSAVTLAIFFLCFLFYLILSNGIPGLFQHYVTLSVNLDQSRLDPKGDLSDQSLFLGEASELIRESLYKTLGVVDGRKEKKIGNI